MICSGSISWAARLPSALLRGYSGTALQRPAGFALPLPDHAAEHARPIYLGGLVARPTTITLGETGGLEQPTWSDSGSSVAQSVPQRGTSTGCANQVWSLGYDAQGTVITSLTTPSQVQTRFTTDTRYLFFDGGNTPTTSWGVTQAQETDLSGKSAYSHTVTKRDREPLPPGMV